MFHKKTPQKDAPIGAMNSAALAAMLSAKNCIPFHTLPEGLKTLLLALCVMCIVRNPREKEFSVKIMGAIASNWFVLTPQLTRQKF